MQGNLLLGLESEQMDTSLPLVAPNQWPDDEAAFLKAEIMAYYTAVLGLSKVIGRSGGWSGQAS